MKTIKTSELSGAALDWAVAKCEGVNAEAFHLYYEPTEPADYDSHGYPEFHYSTVWAQAGPIIAREQISVDFDADPECGGPCVASTRDSRCYWVGPTPLVAAMRCYVALKLGDTVEVPDALL